MPAFFGGKARAGQGEQGSQQDNDLERSDPVGNCQKDLDSAMGVMRENMTRMADRDSKLSDLQDKSTQFASTSEKFTGQAKTLQWKTKWQQYRLYALAAFMVLWVVLALVFRNHLPVYFAVSTAVFAVLFAAQHFLTKQWISQVDKTQLLNANRSVE
uniref:V-SNARE coiled-coil homology domain-containing protein n=1 Tax=Alexandrium catenella TaxID=2925 RepID=A0A7S1LRZ8_ALECA